MYKKYPDETIKDLISLTILKLDCINGKVYVFLLINMICILLMNRIHFSQLSAKSIFQLAVNELIYVISTKLAFTNWN